MELINAIKNYHETLAIKLIESGTIDFGYISENGRTALINACAVGMKEVALALIATGESKPEQVDNYNGTALIHACFRGMEEVALALIATGKSKPEHIGSCDQTALIFACTCGMSNVALALIKTGKSKPKHKNKFGKTALFWACTKGMSNVALNLIEIGKSKPEYSDKYNQSALFCACANDMSNVILKLIEFNCRLGDPEAINVLQLLDTSLDQIFECINNQNLHELDIKFNNMVNTLIYVVPKNYGLENKNLLIEPNQICLEHENLLNDKLYLASMKNNNNSLVPTSSRSYGLLFDGKNFNECQTKMNEYFPMKFEDEEYVQLIKDTFTQKFEHYKDKLLITKQSYIFARKQLRKKTIKRNNKRSL